MGTAPDTIKRLVEHFDRQIEQIRSPDYNEAQLRIDFINPMLRELGWDLDNLQGLAEQYREVVYEDRIKVGGATKAPDYSVRFGGLRKFFLEAKKPSVKIKESWEPAYQLRRYGWSAKLAVSVLTNFEELAVYDCRVQPKQFDKAATARREYITYRQYEDRWDFLVGTFSKQAVLQGNFDRYCGTTRGRGAQEFDEAFLVEIEAWRTRLASNLALRNDGLDQRHLNFACQRIIDRIIFLRICEDRGIERVGRLQALLSGDATYPRLLRIFHDADARYNSGLFHFKKEKGRDESPDLLTPALEVDDVALKSIIRRLYYPESPYEFTVVSADILGSVYERFLGKIITLTAGHRARVDEKPEVRKAGGVYYTPIYIVDHIVQQTLGELLETAKSPKEASKLAVLDPACGSGSFLLSAYQCLLDWHLKWYIENGPESFFKGKKATLRPGPDGQWRLSINERKRILLNGIYGVDIDYQAVEVTKLSLLLKVLEGETAESLGGLWGISHERALPDLGKNIQCGNSLVGTEITTGETWRGMSEDHRRDANPFDYRRAFAPVFKRKGFDAVIGNPPYIRVSNIEEYMRPILYEKYELNHRFDIYVAFLTRGYSLLHSGGVLGFIVPNKFFTADYGLGIRRQLSETRAVAQIVDFGDNQVFSDATTYTCLLFLSKAANENIAYARASTARSATGFEETARIRVASSALSAAPWSFLSQPESRILERASAFETIGAYFDIQHGLQTGMDAFFLLDLERDDGPALVTVRSALEKEPFQIETGVLRTVVKGLVDLGRYHVRSLNRRVFFPYSNRDGRVLPMEEVEIRRRFPKAWAYLRRHRDALEARGASVWHAFRRRNYDLRDDIPRILVPSIATRTSFTFDPVGNIHFVGSGGGGGGGYGLNKHAGVEIDERYALGLLNSTLLDWMLKQSNSRFGHGYYSFNRQFIQPLRIPSPKLAGKRRYDEIIALGASMLSLCAAEQTAKLPQAAEQMRRQIQATDRRIDQLVYELYELSAEQILIIEAATAAE